MAEAIFRAVISAANQVGVLPRSSLLRVPRANSPPATAAGKPGRQPDHQPRALSGRKPPASRARSCAGSVRDLRREALILQSLINHPWLLHDHLEEIAALELGHPEAHKLRAGIIAAYANYSHTDDPAAEAARLRRLLGEIRISQANSNG